MMSKEWLTGSQTRGKEDVAKLKVMTFTRTTLPKTMQSIDKYIYIMFPTIRHSPEE